MRHRDACALGDEARRGAEVRGLAALHEEVEDRDCLPRVERVEGAALGVARPVGDAGGRVLVAGRGAGITAFEPA